MLAKGEVKPRHGEPLRTLVTRRLRDLRTAPAVATAALMPLVGVYPTVASNLQDMPRFTCSASARPSGITASGSLEVNGSPENSAIVSSSKPMTVTIEGSNRRVVLAKPAVDTVQTGGLIVTGRNINVTCATPDQLGRRLTAAADQFTIKPGEKRTVNYYVSSRVEKSVSGGSPAISGLPQLDERFSPFPLRSHY